MLDFDLFRRVIDETGPTLVRIDFFNYGEAFLHKRAVEMCEYIKARYPHIFLYTSTNGLAFTEAQVRRLVHSGIDEVTFSIDGATPELRPYRQRGDFARPSRTCARPSTRSERLGTRRAVHQLALHPLPVERQRPGDGLARRLAAEIGVDRLCWELTDHPEDAFSRRFLPGTPDVGHPPRDLGRQPARQRHPRRDATRPRSRSRVSSRRCRSSHGADGRRR
jgi:hypothetical protein